MMYLEENPKWISKTIQDTLENIENVVGNNSQKLDHLLTCNMCNQTETEKGTQI